MDDPRHRTNLDGTDLDEATRLRLLVDAVVDYAIYMLDATGRAKGITRPRASASRRVRSSASKS